MIIIYEDISWGGNSFNIFWLNEYSFEDFLGYGKTPGLICFGKLGFYSRTWHIVYSLRIRYILICFDGYIFLPYKNFYFISSNSFVYFSGHTSYPLTIEVNISSTPSSSYFFLNSPKNFSNPSIYPSIKQTVFSYYYLRNFPNGITLSIVNLGIGSYEGMHIL